MRVSILLSSYCWLWARFLRWTLFDSSKYSFEILVFCSHLLSVLMTAPSSQGHIGLSINLNLWRYDFFPPCSETITVTSDVIGIFSFILVPVRNCGFGSSVGIATDYGLDGPGSNPGGDEVFPPIQTGSVAHPASCKMGTGSFPVVKCSRGVLLTTHPLLVPRSQKSRAIPLPSLWDTPGL